MSIRVCIIGAGPAGLMAAIHSASAGAETILVETNTIAGRKLLLTGGGRCNFTHQSIPDQIVRTVGPSGRFLRYCLHKYPPQWLRRFFSDRGLQSKVEPTGCVFPITERARDVRNLLMREAKKLGVHFKFGNPVKNVLQDAQGFSIRTSEANIHAHRVIIATGGISYPQTGSTGDGYKFARHLGHTIIPPKPAIIPLITTEKWPSDLAGTLLQDVKISTTITGRKIATTGPMLFTDDGIGGPAVLDLSRFLTDYLPNKAKPIRISIDLLRSITESELQIGILQQIQAHHKKTIANILAVFIPRRLTTVLCNQSRCDSDLTANQLSKQIRAKLLHSLKALQLSVIGTRSIAEAVITHGGVSISEIDPKIIQSKLCPGLFFAGEVMDIDGPCGGYNLHIAFATAALAGKSAAHSR
jgi:predicted Rossmann fold flavoprotein